MDNISFGHDEDGSVGVQLCLILYNSVSMYQNILFCGNDNHCNVNFAHIKSSSSTDIISLYLNDLRK